MMHIQGAILQSRQLVALLLTVQIPPGDLNILAVSTSMLLAANPKTSHAWVSTATRAVSQGVNPMRSWIWRL